ncbi:MULTISPECIES: chain length determinant protein [Alcaligenes]|uniref:chain length determinant protein n=1 Tax=Alcaligenes TaxID=507 RepID=UPI0002AAB986|nr:MULTISPECIES: chain length determinant protein [Alcaligenes]EKU28325.1 chain length determinant protein [Alcaligenes sp. HPC1271]ERI32660.2 chain-length determining protein [Alcaligenes sp. EGD-AK7]HRO20357.1 chain-length determining protein [Alcaligenes phenolicus]HRP14052.1 chain-length determining protein [Alcaligenes phenolicus]
MRLFDHAVRVVLILAVLTSAYWLIFASNRYVSEANVIIRKTDSVGAPSFDLGMLVSGVATVDRANQLLLRDYLLSVDMLKKLDESLDLRTHYSSSDHDLVSRMWFQDASLEWFHRHYLRRVEVEFDDFSGVLRIKVQAYNPEMAQAITELLVKEGERYMNVLGHEMAQVQVDFLVTQVDEAQERFQKASQDLLNYQNAAGLLSPQATAESINAIVAALEGQRAQLQTQLASLPKSLDRDHPNILMLKQSLKAVDEQIKQEKLKLATPSGGTLNAYVEEFYRLDMNVKFTQELYKSSLTALEKGRIDATRMLEKVSVLQSATLPEYPMEPRRLYNTLVTLLLALILAGILKLLKSIVLDHVD